MIDSIFSAALTFCILVGGTIAIVSALRDEAPAAPVVQQASKQVQPATGATRLVAASQAAQPTTLR